MFKHIGLAVKLNVLVLLVLALFLVVVAFLLVRNTQELTEKIGGEKINEEVNIIQSRLDQIETQLLDNTGFIVTNVAFFQAVGKRSSQETTEIITTANASLGVDDITVVDGDGKHLVDLQVEEDTTQEDRLLHNALTGQVTNALLIEEDTQAVTASLTVAKPVISETGNILGALQMSYRMSSDFLTSLIFESQGIHLGLFYGDRVIARSNEADGSRDKILHDGIAYDPQSVQLAQSGQTVVLDHLVNGSSGIPYTVAYVPVQPTADGTSAVIMILVELEEIYTFQNVTLLNTILVFAGLTTIALAIIYLNIYRMMIRPLHKLRTIAQTMTSGRYSERAVITTADEVGQLASAFNEMAIAIQQREVSLEAAREQAERADQVKSMFLASISHELRTPLNAIINLTKFVGLGMYGDVNTEQIDILNKVETRSKHLLNLINDVLDISKIETGSLELFVEENLNVGDIVRQTVETAQSLLLNKPVEIIQVIESDLPSFTGDAQRVQQIVLNLLSNACKFTEEGTIQVNAFQEQEEIIISIQDSGPGIAPQEQQYIFEAFRQTKDGLRKGNGTGLGLPISQRLSEAHGGRIWMKSVEGKGSTFYVALPLASPLMPTI